MTECRCYACTVEDVRARPAKPEEMCLGVDWRLGRMFLCETCGNKRCPHAADHRLACSGSNEPGQKGSLYENAPRFEGASALPAPPPETEGGGYEGKQGVSSSGADIARTGPIARPETNSLPVGKED